MNGGSLPGVVWRINGGKTGPSVAAAQRTYERLGMVDAGYRMYEAPTP